MAPTCVGIREGSVSTLITGFKLNDCWWEKWMWWRIWQGSKQVICWGSWLGRGSHLIDLLGTYSVWLVGRRGYGFMAWDENLLLVYYCCCWLYKLVLTYQLDGFMKHIWINKSHLQLHHLIYFEVKSFFGTNWATSWSISSIFSENSLFAWSSNWYSPLC